MDRALATWLRVILLFVLATVPFAIMLPVPADSHYKFIPGGFVFFYFLTGLAWCCLFIYTWVHAGFRAQKRLLWMLPLVLFAFGLPGYIVCFYVAVWVQALRGVAPP
jgi:hypothetical protein